MKITSYLVIFVAITILSILVITSTANTLILEPEEDFSEEEMNELLEAIYDDISTYMKIDKIVGEYESNNGQRVLSHIAIQIHSLFTKEIQINNIIIELSNGYDMKYFTYTNECDVLRNYSLFSHPMFKRLTGNSFGIITIIDNDDSIIKHQLINHNSDRLFIIISLKDPFMIKSGDSFSLTLHPPTGTIRTISIDPPFSTHPIVDLLK